MVGWDRRRHTCVLDHALSFSGLPSKYQIQKPRSSIRVEQPVQAKTKGKQPEQSRSQHSVQADPKAAWTGELRQAILLLTWMITFAKQHFTRRCTLRRHRALDGGFCRCQRCGLLVAGCWLHVADRERMCYVQQGIKKEGLGLFLKGDHLYPGGMGIARCLSLLPPAYRWVISNWRLLDAVCQCKSHILMSIGKYFAYCWSLQSTADAKQRYYASFYR